ncbi:hypothetical protein ANO11243_025020 [Dothideomycetidae sp. 11243]|nr:hypothetical protein ANO11243_025020 [fungal sp. No.11243]
MSSPHETTPLLQQPDAPTEASPRNTFYEPWTKSQKTTIVLVVLVMACFELAIVLIKLPSTYLFETGICRQYYSQNNPGVLNPDGSVDRDLCQLPHIQEDLSRLNTRFNTIETLLVFFLTGSSELVFQLLAAFVAAVFLARELVKTAILVGTGVLIPALVLLYFVPFDTPRIMSTHAPDSASSELLDTGDARSLKYRINEKIRHYTRLLFPCSVLKPGVLELLGTIFIMNLARQIQIPLVRSMPNKLGWTSYQLAPYRADFSMAIIGLAALLFSALIMSLSLATIPFILGG